MHGNSLKRMLGAAVVVTLASAALVAVSTGTADAAPVPCQRTYASGTLDTPIPDDGSIFAPDLDVFEDGLVVSDVDVTLNVTHTWVGDLSISVVSYTDANALRGSAYLFDIPSGTAGNNLVGTVLDDQAALPVTWGAAPYTGRFKAINPLADMNGFAGGKYRLVVRDQAPGSTGTLNSWSVTLRYQSCDFDSDGVEDHKDRCLGLSASTATGCPLTTRRLTASYGEGKFRGKLISPVAGCKAARKVSVWKVRTGPDLRIGVTTTRADGSYRLFRAKRLGRFYAQSPRVAVTGIAECPAVKSATFRIR